MAEPGERRGRKESLLSLNLECWWRVRRVLKALLVSLGPQVRLDPQALLEILERGALLVAQACPVLMACQAPQGLF